MDSPEIDRLVRDMQQAALRETLGAALTQCGSAEEAAAMLQRAGYSISVQELEAASAELPDQSLDAVSGGGLFTAWLRDGVSIWDMRSRC